MAGSKKAKDMQQQRIRIETLGDLAAHGYGLNATCERCRRRTDLDLLALIERFGPDFVYVGRHIDDMLVCAACGARAATGQVKSTPTATRSEPRVSRLSCRQRRTSL